MADLREIILKSWLDLDAKVLPLRMREDELKKELRSVKQQIEKLSDQITDAELAAKAIGLELSAANRPADKQESQGVSIKQAIRLVLNANKGGLSSAEIHRSVSEIYFANDLDRTSFSPQLSRMKAAGEVHLNGATWSLTEEGRQAMATRPNFRLVLGRQKNEPADVSPSSGSDAALDHDLI